MAVDEARWWCDRHAECAGFSLNAAVPPSVIAVRTEEENGRVWVRFTSSSRMWYAAVSGGGELAGWLSYTKQPPFVAGRAANVGALRDAPLSWLQQPGFIVAPAATPEEMAAGTAHLLRTDEQAALSDVLDWCAASDACEGFTTSVPQAGAAIPLDRLQASACYCCRVDVRTNRGQQSWTKWAMPSRTARAQLEDSLARGEDARARVQAIGHGPPHSVLTAIARGENVDAPSAPPPPSVRIVRADSKGGEEVPAALHLALRRMAAGGQGAGRQESGGDGGERREGDDNDNDDEEEEEDSDDGDAMEGAGTSTSSDASGAAAPPADFLLQMGYVVGGTELHSAFMGIDDAQAWCARRLKCAAFAARAPRASDGPSAVMYVTFSSGSREVFHHPEWLAWTRIPTSKGSGGEGQRSRRSAAKEEL